MPNLSFSFLSKNSTPLENTLHNSEALAAGTANSITRTALQLAQMGMCMLLTAATSASKYSILPELGSDARPIPATARQLPLTAETPWCSSAFAFPALEAEGAENEASNQWRARI